MNARFNANQLRVAGAFELVGLLMITVGLSWQHPLAVMLIYHVGQLFVGLGVLVFLYSVTAHFLKRRRRITS